jgi:hypothetical protein
MSKTTTAVCGSTVNEGVDVSFTRWSNRLVWMRVTVMFKLLKNLSRHIFKASKKPLVKA